MGASIEITRGKTSNFGITNADISFSSEEKAREIRVLRLGKKNEAKAKADRKQ